MTDDRSNASRVSSSERSILPSVARPSAGLSTPAIVVGAIVIGLLLFALLNSRRHSIPPTPPPVAVYASDTPPPLFVPPLPPPAPATVPQTALPATPVAPVLFPPAPASAEARSLPRSPTPPSIPTMILPANARPTLPPPQLAPGPRSAEGAAIILDRTSGPSGAADQASASRPGNATATGPSSAVPARARAGRIADRSTTIAQGTVIPAVLETAINSSGSGFVRALVQRDISSFDGRRVLVPRGSRIIGEYASETGQGQHRVLINWQRLIRPDGATMEIGSPAVDQVGAAGVRASVNSHFFARFADAFLQTAVSIGSSLAVRRTTNTIVVAGSNPLQSITGATAPPPPTLSVRQGSSVSVFVARDLDFSDVDTSQ